MGYPSQHCFVRVYMLILCLCQGFLAVESHGCSVQTGQAVYQGQGVFTLNLVSWQLGNVYFSDDPIIQKQVDAIIATTLTRPITVVPLWSYPTRYGVCLGWVDGLSLELLQQGLVVGLPYPMRSQYWDAIRRAEIQARTSHLGLWGGVFPIEPSKASAYLGRFAIIEGESRQSNTKGKTTYITLGQTYPSLFHLRVYQGFVIPTLPARLEGRGIIMDGKFSPYIGIDSHRGWVEPVR
jgi:hypothetical protein